MSQEQKPANSEQATSSASAPAPATTPAAPAPVDASAPPSSLPSAPKHTNHYNNQSHYNNGSDVSGGQGQGTYKKGPYNPNYQRQNKNGMPPRSHGYANQPYGNGYVMPPQMMMANGYYPSPQGGYPSHVPGTVPVVPQQGVTPFSPVKKPVSIVIKNKEGQEVHLPTHKKTPSISSTPSSLPATPVVVPVTLASSLTPTPAVTATPAAATSNPIAAPPKTKLSKAEFQKQFLEQLRKKKEAQKATSTATASTPAETKQAEETPAPAEEPVAAPAKVEEPVKEEEKPAIEETETPAATSSAPVEEEPKEETPVAPVVEEEKKEETSADAPVVEETKEETPAPVSAETETETAPETETEASTATPAATETEAEAAPAPAPTSAETETETETPAETPEAEVPVEDNRMSITAFMTKVNQAKSLQDPYNFTYPEGLQAPAKPLKKKTIQYDPLFLLQFDSKLDFKLDDEWKNSHIAHIQVIDRSDSNDRSYKGGKDSRARSNGPSRGSALRGDFDRNNSRMGSKRKGGRDGMRGDGRDRSRRGDGKDPSRRSRGGDGKRDRDGRPGDENKNQIKLAPEDVKPLEKSANRWVPKVQKKIEKEVKYAPDGVTVIMDAEDLEKNVRSLLNKLSLEKFDSISEKMIALANQSQWETDAASLKAVIRLTFAKATDEPHWSKMYAQFCQKLVGLTHEDIYSEELKTENGDYVKGSRLSYRILVSRCQEEYSKGWSTDVPVNEDGSPIEPELMSDEYYALAAQKRRGLGLVRFIGELYILSLIRIHVITGCIAKLTADKVSEASKDPNYLPQEDTLETLNEFLITVGPKLEAENPQCCDYAFNTIRNYTENPKIGSRIKYKFLDLIDLRKDRWKSANEMLAGPKKLSQVHQDFEKHQQAQERERERERMKSRTSRSSSRWGSEISSNDIQKVGLVRKTGESSMSSLRKGKVVHDDFTTVSSGRTKSSRGGFTSVSRSSSQVSMNTKPVEESESRQQSSNNFALLMNESDEEGDDHTETHEEEREASEAPAAEEETTEA
jgi:translation initiation factor 4G